MTAMRLALPQPYCEIDHTGDVGVEVRGATAEETVARLILAEAALMAGGGAVDAARVMELHVGRADRETMAVDLLRELLLHFAMHREIAGEVEILTFDPAFGATVRCTMGPYDPVRHVEGGEIKAVTLHDARFEQDANGWLARVIFDV